LFRRERHLRAERNVVTAADVNKLLEAEFIREFQYPKLVSNVVLAKNPNGTCRMYIDFINLSNTCPKDIYLLPKTDKFSAAGREFLSYMDSFF